MRKLVLVKATYDIGNPEPSEQTHLLALNVNKLDHFTANEEMEMAVTKAKLYYEMEMPHAKIISIVASPTISSDNVPQKKEEGLTLELPVFNFHPMSEIPELNPKETDTSFDVLIDIDGHRKDFYIGCYHTDYKEWTLKKEDTDDYEIDFKHAKWAYPPHAARDKK